MRTIPASMNGAGDTRSAHAYHVQSQGHFATRRWRRRLDQACIAVALSGILAIVLPAICMVLAGGSPA